LTDFIDVLDYSVILKNLENSAFGNL